MNVPNPQSKKKKPKGEHMNKKHNQLIKKRTGESMNAEDAVSFGLINKKVPLNELEITVLNFAKLIASKPTSTVRIGKEAFYKQAELPIEKAYKYTSEVMAQNMLKKDAKEGIEAFLETREPKREN